MSHGPSLQAQALVPVPRESCALHQFCLVYVHVCVLKVALAWLKNRIILHHDSVYDKEAFLFHKEKLGDCKHPTTRASTTAAALLSTMTGATKVLALLAILCVQQEANALNSQAFLSPDQGKKKASVLDSKFVQERLEALSGKKVDAEELKKSFEQDKWAGLKTVLGSAPLFNFLQLDRGTPFDKDNSVKGLELVQEKEKKTTSACDPTSLTPCEDELANDELNKAKKTPPLVELQMELKAIPKIYNDIQENKATFETLISKQLTTESAEMRTEPISLGKFDFSKLPRIYLIFACPSPGAC